MSISEAVQSAGAEISSAAPAAVADTVNDALNRFIGDHFSAGPGHIVDKVQARSQDFPTIIHRGHRADGPISASSDTVAAVIDVTDELTIEQLRENYRRVADAKSLAKTPVVRGETRTNVTLGIIFATRSSIPLDTIAEELAGLNEQTPSTRWPDMIVVGKTIINYAVQLPDASLSAAISCRPPKVQR